MSRIQKFLIVQRVDGKFFYFNPGRATCHFEWVDSPLDATRRLYEEEEEIKDPTWYFENSDRMKKWLHQSRMVVFEIKTDFEDKNKCGPMHQIDYDMPREEHIHILANRISQEMQDSIVKMHEMANREIEARDDE